MVAYLLNLLCWSASPATAGELPCLNSRPECIDELSEGAIVQNDEIVSIDERLELVGKQIHRQYERRWTAILPALGDLVQLNPLSLIGSLFGGGSFRDVDLKIADLEVRVSDLVRRRAELTVSVRDEVLGLVLEVEKGDRQLELLRSQVESQGRRVAIAEVGYRLGQGETIEMMSLWQQTENLGSRLVEAEVGREQVVRKLLALVGDEATATATENL
jgi:hypothetical protein